MVTVRTDEIAAGAQIRAARLRLEWTQAHLGMLAGLTRQGIDRIERGQVGPSLSTYRRLTEALGIPLASIVPGRRRKATRAA